MPKHRERSFKPLLFDTTLRNPERIKQFLSILKTYENTVLNNALIHLIVRDVIAAKIYKTNYEMSVDEYKRIYYEETESFTSEQLEDIIANSPQNHQEGGFDRGWPSRFFTWYKFIRALGFVYFNLNEKIKISKTGDLLIKALNDDNHDLEKLVFRNAMSRFNRNSAFIFSANENKPFPFLVAALLRIKEIKNQDDAGFYRFEIPYFLCWKDSNVEAIVEYILEQRERLGLNPSAESIYDNCKQILDIDDSQENLYKISNITREMPDEYIRKMRLTGMISLRGAGNYLDLSHDYLEEAKYIRDNYLSCQSFSSEKDYFDYASGWDEKLGTAKDKKPVSIDDYMKKFLYQVDLYTLDELKKEFEILGKRDPKSSHPIFKLLDAKVRLEFLTALLLKKVYPSVDVYPNYEIDDEGYPTSTAGGGQADIYCDEGTNRINVEVTMLRDSTQNTREFSPIMSHWKDTKRSYPKSFIIFVAPVIHNYTTMFVTTAEVAMISEDFRCSLNSVPDFLTRIDSVSSLEGFRTL